MAPAETGTTRPSAAPGWLYPAYLASTALVVVLVLVQAGIAGQFLFGDADIRLHGYIGNASFALAVIAAALAFFARVPGWLMLLSFVLVLALFSQTGLGYVGRDSTTAAAWHVFLGVTSFGVSVAALTGAIVGVRRG
jgi:hypothetical protein